MSENTRVTGLIGWFASNHVAANLLMVFIVMAGLYAVFSLKKESFPSFDFDIITVAVPYPGAGPEEVEEGIVVKIEEAVENIEGIREMQGMAFENTGQVMIEVRNGFDIGDVTDEVKLAVDGINTFPLDAERPIISKQEFEKGALNVQLSGDLDEATMKSLAEDVRDEILALTEVSSVELWGSRPYEIAIEVSELTLREYGLTLAEIAQVIRQWSVDLPGGSIRTESGDIRLRALGQAYRGDEFERIVLLTNPDGTRVRLGDIATIHDGFTEVENYAFFDGRPSLGINVASTEKENEIEISRAVRAYIEERNKSLPEGVELAVWADTTYYLEGRMDMLLNNMLMGAMLVFVILGLFLHIKLAAWVIIGLPVAFLGAMMMLPVMGVTINIMSLFAFIVVLGIVVDDAIIIAEAAYTETEEKGYTMPNIVAGAQRVAVPATFGVLTTIMAFAPQLFITGPSQNINQAMGWVVIYCLLFSLVESKLILPSHLALMKSSHSKKEGITNWVDRRLKRFINNVYEPMLARAIEYRYATVALFVSLIIISSGLVGGGFVRFVFFPEMENDFVMGSLELQEGVPESLAVSIIKQMDSALREVNEELKVELDEDRDLIEHIFAYVRGGTIGRFQVELAKEDRRVSPKEIENRWREKVGEVAGTKELRFASSRHMGGGPPIALKLQGKNYDLTEQAANELVEYLRGINGLYEVEMSANAGPEEIKLRIKPEAEAFGITLADLGRQVREAFYGAEAQRVQRGDSDLRVMVRFPKSERRSVGNLESMWIRLPDGREIPFSAVAEFTMQPGFSAIRRLDGLRTVSVTANADLSVVEPGRIADDLLKTYMPQLLRNYPGVSVDLDGSSMEERMGMQESWYGFMAALFGIYVLMAIPLRSYLQPLIIMSVIPFGIVGAVVGHWILGIAISSLSIVGIIALSGVVVNDSLILVDHVNKKVEQGMDATSAAIDGGRARFRAILLTSLTTFFGLLPILSESSMQAQMVVPMATSLAFGILFATVITLVLVPCLYKILGDVGSQRVPVDGATAKT
ncbi:MAG: efflux RND transporter permease subunit [Pseudomonadota bacterium]|nr:efflux RND transporter permease subunit [Pseudomonadota bacterium]